MRRTRHVVLPVRSWQYIGLLLVSLACVTFGLVARDREGQAGSLTGPELLHRAPHDVDVCPNLNLFEKSSVCLDLPEKHNFGLKTDKGKEDSSNIVRIDKRSIELGISRNELPEGRHRTINERRILKRSSYPMKKFSRSLERIDSKIKNVGLSNRNSYNSEINRDLVNRRRHLSRRYSNGRSRSVERHEEHRNELKTEKRSIENRELKERRDRFEIDTRRMIDSRNIERKENMKGRTVRENRKNVRERIQNRGFNSVERREFRIEDLERRLMKERRVNERRNSRMNISNRRSKLGTELETFSYGRQLNIDVERRNSRSDVINRERRLNMNVERRNSRLDSLNRKRRLSVDEERRNSRDDTASRERHSNLIEERKNFRSDTLNRKRPMRSVNIEERRNSRLDTLNRERRLSVDVERRNSRLDTFNRERRLSVDAERRNSRFDDLNRERQLNMNTERRISRLDSLNRERRFSVDAERRNSRLDNLNRQRRSSPSTERTNSQTDSSNSERRNSRLDILNRERRLSVDVERRNSRLDTFNRERRLSVDVERRNSRLDTFNRERRLSVDAERRNSRLDNHNRQRRSILNTERRNSRLDTFNRERRLSVDAERRDSRLDNLNRQRRSILNTERTNSQLDSLNRERRLTVDAERKNTRLDNLNRQRRSILNTERRNSRFDTLNRERRLSVDVERRNSRLDTLNRERRLNVDSERRNSRLDTVNRERQSNENVERRNSRLDVFNRERRLSINTERRNSRLYISNRERQSNLDPVRKNSRLDTINQERRSSSMSDRTNTRLIRENRQDSESINLNSLRTKRSTSRDNTPADQRNIRRENIRSEIRNVRLNSIKRKQSGNRLEDQRLGRRMIDFEDRKLHDRRSRSIEQRNINAFNRDNAYFGLRRKISIVRKSEYLDHRDDDNKRDLINRLSRFLFAKKDSRGDIIYTRADRSSEFIDHREQRKIFLNRGIIETPKKDRREVNELRRIVRSSNVEKLRNTPRTARHTFDSSLQLDHTRIERNSFSNERLNERSTRGRIPDEISLPERRQTLNKQRRIAKIFTPEISDRKSFVTKKFYVSKQAERLSRSLDNTNRLNYNERRESVENKRRNIRSNLEKRHNDAFTRRENSDFDRTLKLIERSRNNADKKSSYRKLIDLRQSNFLREMIRISEKSTQHRNTLLIPMMDHNQSNVIKDSGSTRRFFDTNRKTEKIFKEFRNEKYGGKIGMISNLLKTNVLLDYNLSFEIIRQPFMIIICILYGSSMSKNNKLFTNNLVERITKLVLR